MGVKAQLAKKVSKIRYLPGNSTQLKQLKEMIAKEQNADRKKELTKRFIQFSGYDEEKLKCKF